MSTEIYARQGDLVIQKLDRIPTGVELKKDRDLVFAGDSSGHRHRLMGPCEAARQGRVTFVRIEHATDLVHEKPDGHETVAWTAGMYAVRPLRERGDGSDRAVED